MTKAPQDIILKPIVTEKSSIESALGKYCFKVDGRATKTEIRIAIEQLFDVKVVDVNTMNYNGKKKRTRGIPGMTSDWKKAVVTIATETKDGTYLVKGGKSAKLSAKYKTSIEEFGFGQ